jgi:SAM-dependent methyltransferase
MREAAVTAPAGQQEADGPNVARVYDYLLGGSHNFDADRAAAAQFLARWPDARQTMAANRAFLGRAVRFLAQNGIRQFLDIGSGIPTMDNVHAIALQHAPDARVVYADIDEVAVLHSRAILAGNEQATAIQADLRSPQAILAHPELNGLLDLSQPVALLLVAVLHFLPDYPDDPAALVAQLREALAPGSYLVISHGTTDGQPPHVAEGMHNYAQTTADFQPRSHAEILRFFDGLDLADPGLVFVPAWRPDDPRDAEHAGQIAAYGGAGRKP